MKLPTEPSFQIFRSKDRNTVEAVFLVKTLEDYFKLFSTLKKRKIEEINPMLFFPRGSEEKVYVRCSEEDLFEFLIIESVGQIIKAVGTAIFDRLDNPDLSVFNKYNITPKEFDRIVKIINENHAFYQQLGLFLIEGVRHRYLKKVTPYLDDLNPYEQLLVKLRAVAVDTDRAHATFNVYKNDTFELKKTNGEAQILLCEMTQELAEKLDSFLREEKSKQVTISLLVTITKKSKRHVFKLISIDNDYRQFVLPVS